MPLKIHIQSPDADNVIDPPVHHILRHLPQENKASSIEQCDVVIVPITHFHWFKFSEENMDKVRGKKWVLMDYSEFGWDWNQDTSYLWGQSMLDCPKFGESEHYRKFDQFVRENPPILTFQRELLKEAIVTGKQIGRAHV